MKKQQKSGGWAILVLVITILLTACGDSPTVPSLTATATPPLATATNVPATFTPVLPSPTSLPLPTITPLPTVSPVPTLPPAPPSRPATVRQDTAQAIRATNWLEVLKKDPDLSQAEAFPPQTLAVTVKASKKVGGAPLLDSILYLDMDGDGVEEAAITLFSGGTAGNVGFLVYRQATPAPKLIAYQDGYKMGLRVEQGKLVVAQAFCSGWEPNCCPSGLTLVTYVLQNTTLQPLAKRSEGDNQFLDLTVSHFYTLLNDRKFEEAYQLLSPAYKAANPYPAWSAGFATTRKIIAQAKLEPAAANTVRVTLTSTDATAGGEISRNFSGTWKLGWQAGTGWLMGEPDIKEVSPTPTVRKGGVVLPLFQPFYQDLKNNAKLALLLPTYLGESEPKLTIYATYTKTNGPGYSVKIGYTPDCDANACYIGTISARPDDGATEPTAKPLKLSNSITGYFIEFSCGASCSDSSLSWTQNKVRYDFSYKAGKQETLLKIVNSAIDNGSL